MKNALLFFVKEPVHGKVKTRLKVHDDIRLDLYRSFVEEITDRLKNNDADVWVCFSPPHSKSFFINWLGDSFRYMPQSEGDLGRRLHGAFTELIKQKYQRIAVIGSDIPEIQNEHINAAFNALDRHDISIGPCDDGGYYLLALQAQAYSPALFSAIEWSTSKVCAQTVAAIKHEKRRFKILEPLEDIDTLED